MQQPCFLIETSFDSNFVPFGLVETFRANRFLFLFWNCTAATLRGRLSADRGKTTHQRGRIISEIPYILRFKASGILVWEKKNFHKTLNIKKDI